MPTMSKEYARDYHRRNPLRHTWQQMKSRCTNPNVDGFEHYGGRGISICSRWMNSYDAFVADMGPRPEGATLDRIDVDGDYGPDNCRWASATIQSRNRRDNAVLTLGSRSMTLADWSEETGISMRTIQSRLGKYGWSVEAALTTPARKYSRKVVS